jgi:colicin import membrane protein
VLGAKLLKSSGNVAYDAAVERAILKSSPLPLPADASLFNRFRDLKLGFQPKAKE